MANENTLPQGEHTTDDEETYVYQETALDTIGASMIQLVDELGATASASAVFSDPVIHGETAVIPCAEIFAGMGMGFGSGSGNEPDGDSGSGGGGGGGGGASARPVAAIIIRPGEVRIEPIVDMTKIVLAGITTAAFVLSWLFRLNRTARKKGKPSFKEVQKAVKEASRAGH